MFDLLGSIAAGFGGRLRQAPEARKLVWLLLVTLFFSACCIFFIAFVSYSRYRAVAGFLPGADAVALCFTAGIALFMYYVSAHVSAFCVESWLYRGSRLAWQGVIIFGLAGILVGLIDFQMNMDGAADVADQSVGEVVSLDEQSILKRYEPEIQRLEARKSQVLEKYHWKGKLYFEPYPVTRHSRATWSLDTAKVNGLDRQIAVQEDLKAQALADSRKLYQGNLFKQNAQRDQTQDRLRVAVRGVYFLQFLLTLVQAFILLRMDEALQGKTSRGSSGTNQPIGFGAPGAVAPSSKDRNEILALREELTALKSQLKGGLNPGLNGGLKGFTPSELPAELSESDAAFLRKYWEVVCCVREGKSNSETVRSCDVSRSTLHNVKRCMRVAKLL